MGFRQIAEFADAVADALSQDAAGADGDETLHRLIAQRLFIFPRVEPGDDAVHAVRRRQQVQQRAAAQYGAVPLNMGQACAAGKDHDRRNRQDDKGRAGVGLFHDQQEHEQRPP